VGRWYSTNQDPTERDQIYLRADGTGENTFDVDGESAPLPIRWSQVAANQIIIQIADMPAGRASLTPDGKFISVDLGELVDVEFYSKNP
jgi:hypothetical protein